MDETSTSDQVRRSSDDHASDVDSVADNGLFDSWRYIFNELITQNRRLNEKVMQLEKQFDRRLNEQNDRLTTAQGQIRDLCAENGQLKQKLDLLQEQIDAKSSPEQPDDRSRGNEETRRGIDRSRERIIGGNTLFTPLGLPNQTEILNGDDHYQSKTFLGFLRNKVNYMFGEASGSDPEPDDNCPTSDADSDWHRSSKVIEKTEQSSGQRPGFFRGEDDGSVKTIQTAVEEPTIDLSFQRLTDENLKAIVWPLRTNQQCKSLRLNNNSITSVGASLLAELLGTNKVLQDLSLFHNTIADNGVLSLARILSSSNNTLVELHLGDNQITDQGVQYLAEMLRSNRSLLSLNLQGNSIKDEGARILAEAIEKHNSTIEILFLNSNNSLTDLTVDFLLQMVRNHRSLKTLSVANCNLSSNGKERLRKAQQCNENLQVIV